MSTRTEDVIDSDLLNEAATELIAYLKASGGQDFSLGLVVACNRGERSVVCALRAHSPRLIGHALALAGTTLMENHQHLETQRAHAGCLSGQLKVDEHGEIVHDELVRRGPGGDH